MGKRREFKRSHEDPTKRLRHGCPFSNADLSAFAEATGLGNSDAEKTLKKIYCNVVKAGNQGLVAHGTTLKVTDGKLTCSQPY